MTVETNPIGPPWTILKILDWTRGYFEDRGIDSPRLDAELLLSHALEVERVQLYAQFDRPLDDSDLATFRALVKRRSTGEPVAYLVGSRGFWTFELEVDPRVLIPRPDTERLIEVAVNRCDNPGRILDVGTGSGAVAIALALEFPEADVVATDISPDALVVARSNGVRLAPNVTFIESDLLDEVDGQFDLIASNPPYVDEDDPALQEAVRTHEPHIALFAENSGLAILDRLIPIAFERLNPEGVLLLEIGFTQSDNVLKNMKNQGFKNVQCLKDLGGHDRVCFGRRSE